MVNILSSVRAFGPPIVTKFIQEIKSRIAAPHFRKNPTKILRKTQVYEIQSGPFAGIKYGPLGADKFLLPRMLGTYEKELHSHIESIIKSQPDLVVVVGGGEGYYAIGMGCRLPKSKIIVFETSKWGRYLINYYARLNQLALSTEGTCEIDNLSEAFRGSNNPVVICDIEGGELGLMDPVLVPDLRRSHILIELHPMYVKDIEDIITCRFSATHKIHKIILKCRQIEDFPASAFGDFSPEEALLVMNEVELRGSGLWLMMSPD
jgi:hypothetical protein